MLFCCSHFLTIHREGDVVRSWPMLVLLTPKEKRQSGKLVDVRSKKLVSWQSFKRNASSRRPVSCASFSLLHFCYLTILDNMHHKAKLKGMDVCLFLSFSFGLCTNLYHSTTPTFRLKRSQHPGFMTPRRNRRVCLRSHWSITAAVRK